MDRNPAKSLAPCAAVYGAGHTGRAIELGTPVVVEGLSGPAAAAALSEPILCLQERRHHHRSHRGARCVRGGGPSIWARLLAVAVEKEAALSNEARGKKVIKKDVMLAYDTLDKVPLSLARS